MIFTATDDPALLDPPEMQRIAFLHHEAGHLILAYYYGWQIGGFMCGQTRRDWFGSVVNRRTAAAPTDMETPENCANEARKLLAGEIAARIKLGLPTDSILFPLQAPDPVTLTAATPLDAIHLPAVQRDDAIRVLSRFVFNRNELGGTWWDWIWGRHAEARDFLNANWAGVEAIAARFQMVVTNQRDPRNGLPIGYVTGEKVLGWCQELHLPIQNPEVVSVSYAPAQYADIKPQ